MSRFPWSASVAGLSVLMACAKGPSEEPGDRAASAVEAVANAINEDHDLPLGVHGWPHPLLCPPGTNVIQGTEDADVLEGTPGRDCILGLGGDDYISGLGGNDIIMGGDGDDVIDAGPGNDYVMGGEGNDQIAGRENHDQLLGGPGDDILLGGDHRDHISGGEGNDVLLGQGSFDFLAGDEGDDAIEDESGGAIVHGGPGLDACEGVDCEKPLPPLDTDCEPLPPGETCASPPCCSAFGVRLACEEQADCDDAEACTTDTCQPALGCFHSVEPTCSACPISWQPSAVTPVFYGHRDYDESDGAPGPVRVFFPSLDGSPPTAPMLLGCGRYPLVLMAHGNCAEAEHYKKWFDLPASLARSGYIVLVPDLPLIGAGVVPPWAESSAELQRIDDMLTWARTSWDYSGALLPGSIGLVGHSWGSLLSARFALEKAGTANAISAYASLSGVWAEWPIVPSPRPVDALTIPKLLMWGTGFFEFSADVSTIWPSFLPPKHRAVVTDAEHFDYLSATSSTCAAGFTGSCPHTEVLARELVFTFFSKYMPPENWASLTTTLPESLLLPPLVLTPEQAFFAGGHRVANDLFTADSAVCEASFDWSAATSGMATMP